MSEIYAPGSIAGPQGPAGPAGSAAAVSALASALMPSFAGRNLYDPSLSLADSGLNAADGSLTIGGQPTHLSPLMYCPGATSMISNGVVNAGNWGGAICLYDANGAFTGTVPVGSDRVNPGAAFALPGTQTYVRWAHVSPWDSVAESAMMCFAAIGRAATLPSGYTAAGMATVGYVDSASKTALRTRGTAAQLVLDHMIGGPAGGSRNLFDFNKTIPGMSVQSDGTFAALAGFSSAMVFCAGAIRFTTNIPVWTNPFPGGYKICTYDANGSFLADISASIIAQGLQNDKLKGDQVYTLPGDQTYLAFTWNDSSSFGGYHWPQSIQSCVFHAGTEADPPISADGSYVPFQGNEHVTIKTASQLGCQRDQSVFLNQDCAPLLNAFLATASVTNPIQLVLDGMFPIGSPLVVAAGGYTTIEGLGWGTGVNVIGGNYSLTLHNNPQGTGGDTPPARTAANIALRNFTVTTPPSSADGPFRCSMMLASCHDVIVENLSFPGAYASNDFMLTITNANRVWVRGCSFASTGTTHDGVHVDGRCEDITISDCDFATGDDAIALNAPEGYGGDISRVVVTNCRFNGSLTVMRIYTSCMDASAPTTGHATVRNVVVSNCTGTVTSVCFNLGITNGGLSSTGDADQVQDVTVSNCSFAAPQGLALLLVPVGSLVFRGIAYVPTGTSAVISGLFSGAGELMLDDVRVVRNPAGNAVPSSFLYVYSGAVMDRVSLLNCRVVDEAGTGYAALGSLLDIDGTIAALRLEAIDLTHIAALFSYRGTGGVAALRGAGVIGTGSQVPDAIMDNNALYLSSNAGGALSIKVGGAVKRVTLA